MAFGGTGRGRMSEKMRKHFLRTANRRLPPPDDHGVPHRIQRQLSQEGLSGCQMFDLQSFDLRMQQLLSLHELHKRGG